MCTLFDFYLDTGTAHTKTIWMYWEQGLAMAPPIVKASVASWRSQNPNYKVIVLTRRNIQRYIGFDFDKACDEHFSVELTPAAKSDVLRLYLLCRFGGVWVDATTLCKQPLDSWLDISDTGFFIFRQPEQCQDRQMVSWFMAADQGNQIVHRLFTEVIRYLSRPRSNRLIIDRVDRVIDKEALTLISREATGFGYLDYLEKLGRAPYFWMFYLYNEVIKTFPESKLLIDQKCNRYVQPNGLGQRYHQAYVAKQTYRNESKEQVTTREQRINAQYHSSRDKRVVSIHLPKTAGTFFRMVLKNTFGTRVYEDYGDRILDFSIDALAVRNASQLQVDAIIEAEHIDFIHGHFYAKKYRHLKGHYDFTTVLREPLDLIISMYNYLNNRADTNLIVNKAKALSFEDFACDNWFVNTITRQLDGLGIDDFELIGFQDQMEVYLDRFEEKYGVPLVRDIAPSQRNITDKTFVIREELSASFVKKFCTLYADDIGFYNECRKKFACD